jgi:glutamate-ammonia-ligase adenylyltransferase
VTASLPASADHSRYVQRVRRRYADDLHRLPPGVPDAAAITRLVAELQTGGRTLASALRVARQLVLERLVVLDVEQGAPLTDVTGPMSALAEATLALRWTPPAKPSTSGSWAWASWAPASSTSPPTST